MIPNSVASLAAFGLGCIYVSVSWNLPRAQMCFGLKWFKERILLHFFFPIVLIFLNSRRTCSVKCHSYSFLNGRELFNLHSFIGLVRQYCPMGADSLRFDSEMAERV